jgi:hypothetical protein
MPLPLNDEVAETQTDPDGKRIEMEPVDSTFLERGRQQNLEDIYSGFESFSKRESAFGSANETGDSV